MTQLLINEGTLFHNILLNEISKNEERVNEIGSLSKNLITLLSTFGQSLNHSCRQMFQKLKIDEDEDQTIVFLSKFIIDLLTELSKKLVAITKKIENEIVNPYDQFIVSQKESKKQLLSKSADMLANLEANSSFLNELNKNFNMNRNIDMSENERQQLKQIYESQMEKCNQKWLSIKKGYRKILTQADSSNSFRTNFTIKIKVKTAKLLNKLVNSPNTEESLNGYEELYEENQNLSFHIKERIRDLMGKSILLEDKQMEEFDGNFNFAYQQKKIIDDFISFFTSFSHIKEDEKKHEKARTLILENQHWAQYFLNRMRSNLHTEIKLPGIKFHEIITIIKYLFASCAENHGNEVTLYNILYISYRLSCNGSYVIRQLGKHESYWQNINIWLKIINYLKSVRDEFSDDKRDGNKKKIRKIFKDGFYWLGHQQNKFITQKKIKSQKIIHDARQYEIACEINYFMARLQLKEKLIFNLIIQISTKYGFSADNTKKLLKFHYFNRQNTVDKLGSNMAKRKKKLQEKYKGISKEKALCICVGKCLKYLQFSPKLVNLRLVSNLWAKHLRNKIFKRFLIQEKNQSLVNKVRIHIYNAYPPLIINRDVFSRMLKELPDFIEHADIINLDVKRSLSWDQSLREMLVNILSAFSFYNPNIGYLQGMNYLCQNILKLTDDEFVVYRIFQYLMNNPYYGMYTANFDGLRTKIYQFMRIVEREKPKLYSHFQTEKLQGEHFLLPWAITLWGQMSGDLCWLMWDGFICKGWKWWIKVGLWLLNILQPELLDMNFEGMMKCFSELSTGFLAMNIHELKDFGIDIGKAKEDIDKIRLEDEVLVQIEKEYKLKVSMLNEYLKKMGLLKKSR